MKEPYTAPVMDVERLEQAEDILTTSNVQQAYGKFNNAWEWQFDPFDDE